MSGVNKVIVVGRLGADPEVKDLGNGNWVAKMSVATSEKWKDKQGEMQERTEWHRITMWGKPAELCGKYLSKGREAYFEGRLQTSSYDKDGVKMYSTDIIANNVQFLGGKDQKAQSTSEAAGVPNMAPGQSHGPSLDATPF